MILEQGIGFDLETVGEKSEYGLQPCRALQGKASISAASFSKAENPQGFLDPDPERLRTILKQVADKGRYLVGWNVSFDAAWCIAVGLEREVFAVKWLDAMLLWRHAVVEPEGENVPRNKRKSYALEAALKEFFPDQAGFKEFDDFQATDEESLRKLLHRNKEDARFTLKLGQIFWDMLNDRQRRAALIEAQCIPQVAWTKVHGIVSSKELAQKLSHKLKAKAEELHGEILESSPEVEGVNLGSSQQLQTLLYDTWDLPATRFSKKTGAPSTDKYALFDLALLDPRARIIKELREAKNNRTKYAEATIKSLEYNGDGKVRPQARIFSTYTSRMSYSSSDKAKVTVEKKGPKQESVWARRAGSGDFFVKPEDTWNFIEAEHLGPAKTGSVAELRRLLKENGWNKDAIKQATTESEKQEIPREVKLVEKKAEVPVGVALHQWKRGQEYRELIRPPEGFTLCELDFAGQEFGWMAVASSDETMLELRRPGEDAHSYMGAQIAQIDYQDLIKKVKAEDPHAALQRKLGKFCIAEGELVLTDQGLVPIEHVSLDHRVWDGVEWVNHSGVVYQGKKEVITYDGLTATPDHFVYTEEGIRCFFEEARTYGYHLSLTGDGRSPIRALDHPEYGHSQREPASGYLCSMQVRLRARGVGIHMELGEGENDPVQGVSDARASRQGGQTDHSVKSYGTTAEARQCNEAEMYQSAGCFVSQLRGAGDRVSVCQCEGRGSLYHAGDASSDLREAGHRPQGQRRSLRAGESEALFSIGELEQQADCEDGGVSGTDVFTQGGHCTYAREVPGSQVRRLNDQGVHGSTVYDRADRREVAVYDVTNAGPRRRYTVSGKLVSNSNLSFQYRVSAKTATTKARVDYDLEVKEAFINQILETYKRTYPGVPDYWRDQIVKCRALGYAETFAGRRVQLKDHWTGDTKWAMESTAINYPIQGTGGDQKYLALAVARNYLPQFGGYFYYELHDGLFFIFPDDVAEKAARFFKKILSSLPYRQAWGVDLPIDFPVDAKIGPSWGELKEV